MSRRMSTLNFERIAHFQDNITLIQGDLHGQSSLVAILEEFEPDEVYNLAASDDPYTWATKATLWSRSCQLPNA
jgi:GDPmannose 4,6-dehydratase